jgi:hypothetical protein
MKSRKIALYVEHKLCQLFSIYKTMAYCFVSAKTSIGRTFMVRHKNVMHPICAGRRSMVPFTLSAQGALHSPLDWRLP